MILLDLAKFDERFVALTLFEFLELRHLMDGARLHTLKIAILSHA